MERFTISLDDKLAHEFDALIAERRYANRSEAVRDLLRAELERAQASGTGRKKAASPLCVASLSYVFNHHQRDLAERLTGLQHEHHDLTVSSMHVHLDHDHCLETVVLRGEVAAVQGFADRLCAETGVHHGKLNLIAVEAHHAHRHGDAAPPQAKHTHIKPAR